MKSIAILSLALTSSALARTNPHAQKPNQLRDIIYDDADNHLHSYFSMPKNQGSIQFNDYTVHRDEADNELRIPVRIPEISAKNRTSKIQNDDENDNELHSYFSMPKNQGSIQFNDYTVHKDAIDDELFKVSPTWTKVNQHFQVQKDDENDNELHSYFGMPKNQGSIQFNDYTVHRDEADNELRVPVRIPEISAKNRTSKIQNDDETDNELHSYFSIPKNQGSIQFNDYTVHRDEADNELRIPVRIPEISAKNRTSKIQNDDEIDNELHSYFSMPKNQGSIQFNDYTVHRDETDNELRVPVRIPEISAKNRTSKIQTDDEADNELHNYYNRDHTFNEIGHGLYLDDEFVLTAAASQRFTKDEIETLASILKLATQDKDGNVMVDGVKVGKMPKKEAKKVEAPKKKTFLGL